MRLSRYPVTWFFVLAFALTVVGQGVHLYVVRHLAASEPGMPISVSPLSTWLPYGFFITNAGPSLVGLLLTLCLYGLPGIRRLAVQLSPWSAGRGWPILIVCLFLPLLVAALPILFFSGTTADSSIASWHLDDYLFVAIVSGGLLGSGLFEEIGWRGFALPHLQRRYTALESSAIVGMAWAFWHWPNYFFIPSEPTPWWRFALLVPVSVAVSVVYTWAYNSTGGNLLSAVFLHGATVAVASLVPSVDADDAMRRQWAISFLFSAVAVGLTWGYGGRNLSWRERVVAGPPGEPAPPHDTDPAAARSRSSMPAASADEAKRS